MPNPPARGSNYGFLFLLVVICFALAVVGDVGGIGSKLGELITSQTGARSGAAQPLANPNSDAGPGELALPPGPPMTEAWFVDAAGYEGAEADRTKSNTGMVVYFARRPCDDCRRFEHELLAAPAVKSALEKRIRVRIDIGNSEKENNLAVKLGVLAAPALVTIAPDGTRHQIALRTMRGAWITPEDLLGQLR